MARILSRQLESAPPRFGNPHVSQPAEPLVLDGVWGQAAEIDERTVDVHVGRLRKALSRGRERDPIRTVRGTGYAFDETFGKDVR
jgi:hypothetical protein